MRILVILASALGAFLHVVPVVADRGFIPFDPSVRLYEPNQDALIVWNGEEELLILTTQLRASAATDVLEVLPLPSKPRVSPASARALEQAAKIVDRHLHARRARKKSADVEDDDGPAARVALQKTIGAHQIAVVQVLDGGRFVKWVKDYLAGRRVKAATIHPGFEKIVKEYIRDRFVWFVFDVVSIKPEQRKTQPIQYRFKSDYLYYPLRITRLVEGSSTIKLLTVTPRRLRRFPRQRVEISTAWTPRSQKPLHRGESAPCEEESFGALEITAAEQRSIGAEIYGLLGRRPRAFLTGITCAGDLSAYENDLVAIW